MKRIVIILVLSFFVKDAFSQSGVNYSSTKKGQVYILWGWNRAAYTKSNIGFKGQDYDFKLYKVSAHDRPTSFNVEDYMRIDRFTTPQTNFRLGYFVRKNLAVSFGFDHLKYVMDNDQTVMMKGNIQRDGAFKGNYNGEKKLTEDFLTFEHTDGLNYVNLEVEKYVNLYHAASNNCNIDALVGGGGGILLPRTNVHLLNYEISDQYHVSGFGLSLKAGIQATLFKHLTIKFENKYGYINMPNIVLHKKGTSGLGKQAFFFTAVDGMIGYSFSLSGKKSNKKKQVNN